MLDQILRVPLQKLFVVTVALKIISAFFGWHLNYPWLLGFSVPLLFMSAYIVLGMKRRDSDVSDEKFADTCYYLGFIFTIVSIIFGLFDLPKISEQMSAIAVRFGAAMVSTVFGLIVRVYLVNFREDADDAIKAAESSIVEASHKFREQLVIAHEKLHEFELQVDVAVRGSIERVNLQVEALTKSYGEKLAELFSRLAADNKELSTKAFTEVETA